MLIKIQIGVIFCSLEQTLTSLLRTATEEGLLVQEQHETSPQYQNKTLGLGQYSFPLI